MTPVAHDIHFVFMRPGGERVDGIVPVSFSPNGDLDIPMRTMYQASYVYDLSARIMLKNKTGRKFLVPLGVKGESMGWLSAATDGYSRSVVRHLK